ncbi:MAG: tRNA (5-methylaminomethyl-2-thiouridine)(34)-methyltransferase MnmD [Saprospiraceae bacterium]
MPIFTTQDGSHTIIAEKFGVSYHSKYGAITESEHVFIKAGLYLKAADKKELSILEVGFGTGLNAFMTWLEAERLQLEVKFHSIEAYPITLEESEALNFAEQLNVPDRQADFINMHKSPWEQNIQLSGSFSLYKTQSLLEDYNTLEKFDIVYFDAFGPGAQPELWTESIFVKMYDCLKPGGILVTFCAQGEFKRTLKKAGFEVERLEGPPGKREMTRAKKQ